MKSSLFFIATIILFSLLILFYELNSTETVLAKTPRNINNEDNKMKMISGQGNQYYKFQSDLIVKDIKEVGNFKLKNDTINALSTQILEDNYSNYLKSATDKSVNLTRMYQDEIALWDSHFYSNITMAKITETFLPKFITQLKQFNNTEAPAKYNIVKKNYIKSFEYEIQSYKYFIDYLKTNNSTANKLSNDNLSAALNYETIARKAFAEANNDHNTPTNKENTPIQQQFIESESRVGMYLLGL